MGQSHMKIREILHQPGFVLGCVGLALCLCVRDAHQFALFDTVRGSVAAQYLLAASRACPLLVLATALGCMQKGARRLSGFNLGGIGRAFAVAGAALETTGLFVQVAFVQDSADLWGLASLGLGQSLLICGWACWLIGLRQRGLFVALIASFACAGGAEALLALMDANLMGYALLALPAFSLGLYACSSQAQRAVDGQETSGMKDAEKPGGDATATGAHIGSSRSMRSTAGSAHEGNGGLCRSVLTMLTFFAYSFIARQLTDTWMERLTDEPLFLFQLFAALGTLLAGSLVYLAFSLRRSYKNPAMYTVFVTFVVCLALYFSLTFTGHLGVLCLVPLFMLRKMLLFLPLYFARGFGRGRQAFQMFCLAMLAVELGNLFQTAFFEAMASMPGGVEVAGSLSMLACMVYIVLVEWSQFFKIEKVDVLAEECAVATDPMAEAVKRMSEECDLSARETEVLACLASGRNAEYVARTLGIAPSTAKTHIAHIYRKTGFNSQQRLMDALAEGAPGNH